jgi:DNA-binding winged helix-turn-helix (wHTH) protein
VRRRFPPFILDSGARQLFRDDQPVHLSRKAFDLLCALVARRPEVVTKQELLNGIWPETFVSDASLNVLIVEIRRALDDRAQTPRFIRTAHGVGYAFCGAATDLDAGEAAPGRDGRLDTVLTTPDRTFPLIEGENVIGRDSRCAVHLADAGVSRRHAAIHVTAAARQALLEDLGSTNGTFVGRRRITAPTVLADGDVVRIGPVELELRAWRAEDARTKPLRRRRAKGG